MAIDVVLQPISIIIELIIAALALHLAMVRKRDYGWLFALTFLIYVVYDSAKFLELNIPADAISAVFFIATLTALGAVWLVWKESE
ncbi:MAG: hypothetical protein ACP5C4_01890 [Methanomicrobiales archaeon]